MVRTGPSNMGCSLSVYKGRIRFGSALRTFSNTLRRLALDVSSCGRTSPAIVADAA
jgi:hypothetical protein